MNLQVTVQSDDLSDTPRNRSLSLTRLSQKVTYLKEEDINQTRLVSPELRYRITTGGPGRGIQKRIRDYSVSSCNTEVYQPLKDCHYYGDILHKYDLPHMVNSDGFPARTSDTWIYSCIITHRTQELPHIVSLSVIFFRNVHIRVRLRQKMLTPSPSRLLYIYTRPKMFITAFRWYPQHK